jgi:Protein of unknown function (DUF2721)
MNEYFDVSDISKLIALAVAPVFLITGIGSILNVLGNRLSRVVDRGRFLQHLIAKGGENDRYRSELDIQIRRMNWVGWSIGLCVASALLICALVAVIFLGGLMHFDPYEIIGVLFVCAMLSLIVGLLLFLLEIRLAIHQGWVKADIAEQSQEKPSRCDNESNPRIDSEDG